MRPLGGRRSPEDFPGLMQKRMAFTALLFRSLRSTALFSKPHQPENTPLVFLSHHPFTKPFSHFLNKRHPLTHPHLTIEHCPRVWISSGSLQDGMIWEGISPQGESRTKQRELWGEILKGDWALFPSMTNSWQVFFMYVCMCVSIYHNYLSTPSPIYLLEWQFRNELVVMGTHIHTFIWIEKWS